jgi:CubicO group peptidase (beta-lactamase class C family)
MMDLTEKISRIVDEKQRSSHIPGVAVVVVKDGEIMVSKGFGYATPENKQPVDMNNTLFRVASVSKTLTITALLQLAEQNKVDLDADVNDYLDDFKIKNRFPKPLKVRYLLSHIDGFEEKTVRGNALAFSSIPPLKTLLKEQLKPLFTEPGEIITYGNTGVAVASYLVENISGMPFEVYIEKNIFRLLGMTKSIMHQNFTPDEEKSLATVFRYSHDKYVPLDTAYTVTPGTGGASLAPNEMAYYLIALLNKGMYNGNALLKPETVSMMLGRQFSIHPEMPGVTFGFFEQFSNGSRALFRDGSGFSITSRIALWPDQNAGMFVVTNKASSDLCIELTDCCFDYFCPGKEDMPVAPGTGKMPDAKGYEGEYQLIQYSRYAISKLLSRLFTGPLRVEAKTRDTITITPVTYDPFSEMQGTTEWVQKSPGLFLSRDGRNRMFFREMKARMHLFSGLYYHSTYERITAFENPRLHRSLFRYFSYLFGLLFAASAAGVFLMADAGTRPLFALCGVISLISAISASSLMPALIMKGYIKGFPSFVFIDAPPRPGLSALFLLPFLNIFLMAVLLVSGIFRIPEAGISPGVIFSCIVLILNVLYLMFLKYWNLLRLKI